MVVCMRAGEHSSLNAHWHCGHAISRSDVCVAAGNERHRCNAIHEGGRQRPDNVNATRSPAVPVGV